VCLTAGMEYDDEEVGEPRGGRACAPLQEWLRKAGRRIERALRWPRSFPPKIWLREDLEKTDAPWAQCVHVSQAVAMVLGLAFVIAAIVVMYRTWNNPCTVPLNAFVLVAAIVVIGWTVSLLAVCRWLTQAARVALFAVSVVVFAWSLLGIVWLAQGSAGGCMGSSAMLFGLSAAFVIVYAPLAVLAAVYFGTQIVIAGLLERRVLRGLLAALVAGFRRPHSPFLGVSVVGDKGVGKTTLLKQLNKQSSRIFPAGTSCRVVDENPARYGVKANRTTFCEDTTMRTTDLVNADCAVIVFSFDDRRSFNSAKSVWFPHVVSHTAVPIVLVGKYFESLIFFFFFA
jgi:hypothetical protein